MALQLKDRIIQTEHGIHVLENELEDLRRQQAQEKYINPYLAYKYAYEAMIAGDRFIPDINNPLPLDIPMHITKGFYYIKDDKKYIGVENGNIADVDLAYLEEVQ